MLTGVKRRFDRVFPTMPVPAGAKPTRDGRVRLGSIVAGGLAGALLGGPVAGFVGMVYAGVGVHAAARARTRADHRRRHLAALDELAAAAAALRAGGVSPDLSAVDDLTVLDQARAASALSERTGAPLADLLERIETQHRALIRSAARTSGDAAGAAMTAALLAALPAAGVGLGYLLGVDPARILLRTPVGAACAVLSVVLQVGGLFWIDRLVQPPGTSGGDVGGRQPRERPGRKDPGTEGDVVGRPAQAFRRGGCRGVWHAVAARFATARARHLPSLPAPAPVAVPASRARVLPWRPLLGAAGAATVIAWCLGGVPGVVVGVVFGGGVLVALLRATPPHVRRERERASRDLPLALDLIAAALRAGSPFERGVTAVAATLPGPLADRLRRAGRALHLGSSVGDALRYLDDLDGVARVITAAEHSAASGAALAGVLRRCATDLREARAVAVEAASRRAGVLIVLPLGLCFLPAFVLAGLVPVLIAFLGDLTL